MGIVQSVASICSMLCCFGVTIGIYMSFFILFYIYLFVSFDLWFSIMCMGNLIGLFIYDEG